MSSYDGEANAPPTSALPTFLESDPYPSQSRDGGTRPTSSASAATDATSDFGTVEDFRSAKERQSNMTALTGLTGPVGGGGTSAQSAHDGEYDCTIGDAAREAHQFTGTDF